MNIKNVNDVNDRKNLKRTSMKNIYRDWNTKKYDKIEMGHRQKYTAYSM